MFDEMLYGESSFETSLIYDVYYNENGHPSKLHDMIGGANAVDVINDKIVKELIAKNGNAQIYRVSVCGFAMDYSNENCDQFSIMTDGIEHRILKMTIEIKQSANKR